MSLNPLDVHPVVKDYHYLQTIAAFPSVVVKTVNKDENCVKMVAEYFNPGIHFNIQHSHSINPNLQSLDAAQELLGKIKWDLEFYRSVLGKLTLSETHLYAITVLTHAVSCDENLKTRIKNKIKELEK